MTYAHVTAGQVDAIGNPPDVAYDGTTRWWDLRPLDPAILAVFGWLPLITTDRPDDTATTTWDRDYTIGPDSVTVTWTERPWTEDELAAQAEQAAREADREAIVEDALVWLAQDAAQAETRASQIAAALADVDAQIAQVAAYAFTGSNVAQINASLNNALKPMIGSILTRQKQIGTMLQELQVARDRHGDALVWVGRYLTR